MSGTGEGIDPAGRLDLGAVGLFAGTLRPSRGGTLDAVAEVEALGFPTLWVSGGIDGETLFEDLHAMLGATEHIKIGVGILNIWVLDAERTAAAYHEVEAAHPDRLLLGLGVSHPEMINRRPEQPYQKPLAFTRRYLDEIDASPAPVPVERRVLAALGPRMLTLAGERTAGAHPYFVPVDHTASARATLGDGPLLLPEQAAVLETDPSRARAVARDHMEIYLTLTNYTNNLMQFGFEPADLEHGGSDRLVDAVVAWGDVEAVTARARAHLDAGADHVGLQIIGPTGDLPRGQWQELASALSLSA